LGAPFIERLRDNKQLNGALAGITAAVVGVILNLAIWFALHTWFHEVRQLRGFGLSFDVPVLPSIDPWALLLSIVAMVAIFRFKAGMIQTLLACSLAGILESDFTLWRTGQGGAGEWTLVADLTAAGRPRDRASEQGPHRLPAFMAAI